MICGSSVQMYSAAVDGIRSHVGVKEVRGVGIRATPHAPSLSDVHTRGNASYQK